MARLAGEGPGPPCQGWNSWWVVLIPESTLYIVTPLPVPTVLFVPNLVLHIPTISTRTALPSLDLAILQKRQTSILAEIN